VTEFLRELRKLEPEQHYYTASEFHVTILTLFTATVNPGTFLAKKRNYLYVVDAALRKVRPIRIEFEGVTASPGALMIQGFFEDEALNDLRDSLRNQLRMRGLGEGLDQRYRLKAAHMTVARFRAPLGEGGRFAACLEEARQRPFGATTVKSLSLVKNDWYMSRRVTETLKRYRLTQSA